MALSAYYGAIENDEERFKVCAFSTTTFRLLLNSVTPRYWTQHSRKAVRSGIQLISMAITRIYSGNGASWPFYYRTYAELMEFLLQVQKDGEPR